MPRDVYPEKVEIKRDDFNTPEQDTAAEEMVALWEETNGRLTKIAEQGKFSRHMYQKVRDRYLGPADDPEHGIIGEERTFEEIREEFGRVSNYLDIMADRDGTPAHISDAAELSDRDIRMFQEGWNAAMKFQDEQDERAQLPQADEQ